MANTTNFNWETPDDTDLVKDGAAAIRTLGNSIDTSFVDLKGGTTGQVLSKASNTDLDFTWVAQDDSNAIQNALLTTTGDTIYASSASTPARLGIGSSGQVLTVSGGVPTWATPSAGEGWTQVSTGSTTSGSALNLSSLTTYGRYKLLFNAVTVASGPVAFQVRFNSDSGTNYDYDLIRQVGSTTSGAGAFSATQSHADNIYLDTIANTSYLSIEIHGCRSTTAYKRFQNHFGVLNNAGAATNIFSSGIYKSNSAVTSINISLSSSSFAAGTYYLYGSD